MIFGSLAYLEAMDDHKDAKTSLEGPPCPIIYAYFIKKNCLSINSVPFVDKITSPLYRA